MPRNNNDAVPFTQIEVDHDDWRDPGWEREFAPGWRAKDKMRGVVVDRGALAIEYENVAGWDGDEFANVWCARLDSQNRWQMRFVSTLTRDDERQVGVDPSGAKIMRHPLDMNAPNLPDVDERCVWVIGAVSQSVRAANRVYVTPDYQPPPNEDPESLLPIVKEERAKYPTPVPNDDLGKIVNAVAFRGGGGWGLAAKSIGAHTIQPVTGTLVSRDVIIHQPSDLMYDILRDVVDAAVPAWNKIGPSDMQWVAPVATNVDPDVIGAPWPCFVDGRAPVLAMSPEGPQSSSVWGEWMKNAYPEHVAMNIDGTHTPLRGVLTSRFADLYRENSARGLVTACWCVWENEGGPMNALDVVGELVALYDSLGDEPGWIVVGPTWDVWQAAGFDEPNNTNDWITAAEQIVDGRSIIVGARARRGVDEYGGVLASFQTHVVDVAQASMIFATSVLASNDRIVGEFDRFRVRNNGNAKDMTEGDIPVICEASRARRVAIIIGHENATGARPFEKRKKIRKILDTGDTPPPVEPPNETACDAGKEMSDIREGFERDVLKPVRDALGGVSNPPSFSDRFAIASKLPALIKLVPIAEEYGRRLREVEDSLLAQCDE